MICTRTLTVRTPLGERPLVISVFDPAEGEHGWSCSYEITWPSGSKRKQASGVDAVQALYLAFQRIGTDLYTSNEHAEGRLSWRKPGDGYGFPVPKNLRGFLVGVDRQFDG